MKNGFHRLFQAYTTHLDLALPLCLESLQLLYTISIRTRNKTMARMRAIEAAVLVMRREGVDTAFGVPGAAINPMYAALKKIGGIDHVLARHVEGASHMAEGYTRTKAGNIGVCIGTSGPAGTDMITGLYSASADSIPILSHYRPGTARPPAQGRLPGGRHLQHRRAGGQVGDHRAGTGPGPLCIPEGLPADAQRPARPGTDRPAVRRHRWPRSSSTSTPTSPSR